ncbi:T-cell immunoreceptor with Ig and ITIM domains [Perognathus longimembris pacificus]|uniref:T-cell immunoreceptor with Ig and ITIM domains n=1 Tax=Perognathus longimembris pacificus TaxID=214514 RepID=UPI002019C496|nr:T-cell immunoreceptor with Ig and ITIM domains [Perognathus longimembris pacificus]
MHRWLLLLWAQGLGQAVLLTSGARTGILITKGNISAEEGDSVLLQCLLSSTMANVTQVNWEQQEQLLAVFHTAYGWYVDPSFRERVIPHPSLGLTFLSLTRNDTGEYLCIYHTFPDGIYQGRIFLEVRVRSVSKSSTWVLVLLLGAMATVLGVICMAVIRVVILPRKKKPLTITSVESGPRSMPAALQAQSPSIPSSPRSCVQGEASPAGPCGQEREDDYAEPHDYFNILSYRSLASLSFLADTD